MDVITRANGDTIYYDPMVINAQDIGEGDLIPVTLPPNSQIGDYIAVFSAGGDSRRVHPLKFITKPPPLFLVLAVIAIALGVIATLFSIVALAR